MQKKPKKAEEIEKLVSEIISEAEFLLEDHNLPKNIMLVIRTIEPRLKENTTPLEVSSILYELEDTTNNTNAPEFRSVIWSIISKLENLKENMK
jgi:uncharacterized protein (UPF0147 family)